MRLDGKRLRARRLQLGLTMRGLARDAQISQTLVKRLEDTGELDNLTCATLQRLVDALSVELVEILEQHSSNPNADWTMLERLGALLLERRSGISSISLGSLLEIEVEETKEQLEHLSIQLRPFGICVHRGPTGMRLVPVENVHTVFRSRIDRLGAPTSSDLRLLSRAVSEKLYSRNVATMQNGNVSLHRLESADLLEITSDGRIVPGRAARDSLQLDEARSGATRSRA